MSQKVPPPPPPSLMAASSRWPAPRLSAVLAVPLLALAAVPTAAQVTVSITSTPANGTHYVAGEKITTRLSGVTSVGSLESVSVPDCRERHPTNNDIWSWRCNWMRIDIGGATREAWTLTNPIGATTMNYEYVVQAADFDSDGISVPANSIVGKRWRTHALGAFISRNHAALPDQATQKVIGSAASISSTTPAALDGTNLHGATVTVALSDVTFESGVTATSFELVTTLAGVSISGVSSVSSGDTTATLTLAATGPVEAATLAVKVLAAAHSGSTDLTTGTVSVVGQPAPEPAPQPNRAPQVAAAPDAVELDPGGTTSIALSGTFQDPEGDPLTFSAASSRPAVASARLDGTELVVSAVGEGQARITVRAADPFDATASVSFLVTVGNPVSIGSAGDAAGLAAAGSAPEGGVAELAVAMAEHREEDVSFAYSFGPDGDPATADADAADHGGEGGTVTILAGETAATIRIPIADDNDIEPAREAFRVELQPMDGTGLAVSSAIVHIEEGVCDRTWQVADALRDGRACAAVTPAELARRRFVRLPDAGLAELKPLDFLGLAGMRVLILDGNGLSALPEGLLAGSPGLRVLRLRGNRFETLPMLGSAPALIELDVADNLLTELPENPFESLPSLGYLYLGGNGIEALPADLLADAEGVRFLELQDNALDALPAGLFAGVPRLFSLQLQGNPGAPFSLPVELAVEADAEAEDANEGADEEEPGRATIQLRMPHAAPFAVSAELSAPGATLSARTATVAAGETLGDPVSVVRSTAGNEADATVTVEITSVSSLPATACGDEFDEYRCFRGFELTPGSSLTLFEPPAAAVPTMH